jgi:hypothetical protein
MSNLGENRDSDGSAQIEGGRQGSGEYTSYLVRLWRPKEEANWMAYVEAAITHDRHVFSDLAGLFTFLQDQTGEHASSEVSE